MRTTNITDTEAVMTLATNTIVTTTSTSIVAAIIVIKSLAVAAVIERTAVR